VSTRSCRRALHGSSSPCAPCKASILTWLPQRRSGLSLATSPEWIGSVPEALQVQIHAAGATAFANGFAAASLVAAIVAAITGVLAFALVRVADTAPAKSGNAEARLVAVME
jgi:sugar phosphate permease